jgi:hypothetical protein
MKSDLNDLKKLTLELMQNGSSKVQETNKGLIQKIYGKPEENTIFEEESRVEMLPTQNNLIQETFNDDDDDEVNYLFAETVDEEERMSIFLLISIFIILWYDDSRNWHALGSLLFIIATIFGLYCFFYYSMSHPNLTLLGLWFFIEWLIIIFYRKQNSKNAIHFSFMQI